MERTVKMGIIILAIGALTACGSSAGDTPAPADPDPGAGGTSPAETPCIVAACSANSLLLQGPDAPLAAVWSR